MKKSVCAVYFPGVLSLMKMLPPEEFDLIVVAPEEKPFTPEISALLEGEGMVTIGYDELSRVKADYLIDDTNRAFGDIAEFKNLLASVRFGERAVKLERKTSETEIEISLDLDGKGTSEINTGIGFFDHMLMQIAQHGSLSLLVVARGDLNVDEHHTVEDTGILLGEAFNRALGSKLGIARYGFVLPMDESRAEVIIDFGGRIDLVWNLSFLREKIGDMPTEMFKHFFKSFAASAKCSLHVSASGENEHHKIEGVFKAFARAVKMAVRRDVTEYRLPSSKGVL